MTVANLFAKHRAGEISKDKFLIEVRKDQNLPWISNLTSYDDAIKILKQKGVIKEAENIIFDPYEDKQMWYIEDQDGDTEELGYMSKEEAMGHERPGAHVFTDRDMIDRHNESKKMSESEDDDQDDFDSTDYLEFTDGNTTVSLYKDGSRWIEGDIVKGKKPYGWGGKTYMSYLTPKDIAGYLSKDYGGKWSSYEGLEESKSPKKIIKESQEELYLSIDRMNPILVYKAVNTELAKLPEISKEIYQKTLEKVVNRLKKDPTAYDDIIISNAKQMRKEDEKRKMVPVKSELKDPHHQMKSPKGLEKVKSNTKETKTENKKGKPKGVKEMSSHAKGHKGMKQMKQPEKKHKVMESIIESLLEKKINEDTHWRYGINQGVETPDGHGIIKNIMGGTLTVELENGDTHDYQLNVINHIADKGQKSINHISPVSKKEENKTSNSDEKKDAIIKKVVEFLKKKKKKVEEDTLIPTSSNKQALKQKIASNSRLNQNQKNSANTAIDKGDIVNI